MAQQHIRSGEAKRLSPLGTGIGQARTHALLKAQQLELVHLILRAGERLPLHAAPGEITLFGIEGRLALGHGTETTYLETGDLVHLPAGVPHTVDALQDASALLTISLIRPVQGESKSKLN